MQPYNEIYFIRFFFRLLVAFLTLICICALTFNINDSVSFTAGEIIAENPQIDYKAPFEGVPYKIYVEEGRTVKTGDTLLILINEQLNKDYESAKSAYPSLRKTDTTVEDLIRSAYQKIDNLKRERQLNAQVYANQKSRTLDELKSATLRADVSAEKLFLVAQSKLKIDSTLFTQNVISKLDITNSYDNYLNYKNALVASEQSRNQVQSLSSSLDNEYRRAQNAIDLRLIDLKERLKLLEKEKTAAIKELNLADDNLTYLDGEVRKQYIIADLDGEIMNVYNVKYAQNFVNKGDLLLSLVPTKDKYYAKVKIPQRDIRYVKVGLAAHLKVDAYNFFEMGILKGSVSYIPDRKPNDDFFVMIDIAPTDKFRLKSGYSLKGEIIIERLKIYQFILKKLFKRLDETTS